MTHAFSHLLLATEHSEQDAGAETLAFAMAQRCGLPLAAVMPIVSNPEYEALAPQIAAHAEAQAGLRMQALQAEARRVGLTLDLQARRGPEPYREIVDEAAARGSDLIVIRRRGRRGLLARLLVGEMVRNVVAHAPCSVLVVPRSARLWSHRVLVAMDPLAPDTALVASAAAIAAECRLPLTVLCVTEPAADAVQRAERALLRAASTARALGVEPHTLTRIGRPHAEIVAAAHQLSCDLLVIGRHGSDSLAHAWLGGVAQKVIGLAEQPVLVAVTSPTLSGTRP